MPYRPKLENTSTHTGNQPPLDAKTAQPPNTCSPANLPKTQANEFCNGIGGKADVPSVLPDVCL
jgi:hypothetical protein